MGNKKGFTIVELLIVIVVIGILATITIVAYNGVQGRANNTAVQNDLRNVAQQLELYYAKNNIYPRNYTELNSPTSELEIKVAKSSYGNHYFNGSGYYNFLYCSPSDNSGSTYAMVARSSSGDMFKYTPGSGVAEYTGAWTGSVAMCAALGVTISNTSRDWLYDYGNWRTYVK